jgi:hypothetical protein
MNIPEKGFYYHYKHDPAGDIGKYAYEVLNIAYHTEIENPDERMLVIYRPLYKSFVYEAGNRWDARPLTMFMEKVVKDGREMERFTKIADSKVISELEKIRDQMY